MYFLFKIYYTNRTRKHNKTKQTFTQKIILKNTALFRQWQCIWKSEGRAQTWNRLDTWKVTRFTCINNYTHVCTQCRVIAKATVQRT